MTTTGSLYRKHFVGRGRELALLRESFDLAARGETRFGAVFGESGIGKTALCEQVAAYAGAQGGAVFLGRSYETTSFVPPYQPFIEILRGFASFSADREAAAILRQLTSFGADPATDGDSARWQLFESIAALLQGICALQPVLIVIEDLHWADGATLELLLHLARRVRDARMLILTTCQDLPYDPGDAIASLLNELRRTDRFLRISLGGLSPAEAAGLCDLMLEADTAGAGADIARRSEGNPLFLLEMVRQFAEEAQAAAREAPRTAAGLRDAIALRFRGLDQGVRSVLEVAAVIGRDFRLDILDSVLEDSGFDPIRALDESVRRAIIEPTSALGPTSFRFAHGLLRAYLYDNLFAPRRDHWHRRIGLALYEIYGPAPEEHAAEISEHLAHSSDATAGRNRRPAPMSFRRRFAVRALPPSTRRMSSRSMIRSRIWRGPSSSRPPSDPMIGRYASTS